MVDQTAIQTAAAKLAALDFSAENAEIERLEAEIEECVRAEATANRRKTEIHQELSDPEARFTGSDVADRLLEGGNVATIAASREDLNAEDRALDRGIKALMERGRAAHASIDAIRVRARKTLQDALAPTTASLGEEAKQAAQRLIECYAAIAAIDEATRTRGPEHRALEPAAKGIYGEAGCAGLFPRFPVSVPAEIVALLSALDDVGPALQPRLISQIKPY